MPNEPQAGVKQEKVSATPQASDVKAPVLVAPSSSVSLGGQPVSVLEGLDRRIAEASPYEAGEWVRVRGEIVKQNIFVGDRAPTFIDTFANRIFGGERDKA